MLSRFSIPVTGWDAKGEPTQYWDDDLNPWDNYTTPDPKLQCGECGHEFNKPEQMTEEEHQAYWDANPRPTPEGKPIGMISGANLLDLLAGGKELD
jgi:hypothetical protein